MRLVIAFADLRFERTLSMECHSQMCFLNLIFVNVSKILQR